MEAVDEKGEKYISPENRKILEEAINNLKQNYPDLLEEIEEEVEALGKELDDSGQPPLKNKINEEQLKLIFGKDYFNKTLNSVSPCRYVFYWVLSPSG